LFGTSGIHHTSSTVIKKTTTLPVIDGQIDAVWNTTDGLDIAVPFQLELPTLGAANETYWKALWTDAGIYFLINVTDDEFYPVYKALGNDYEYDKLELYFDVNTVKKDGLGAGANKGHYDIIPGFAEGTSDGTELLYGSGDAECHYAFLVTEPNYVAEYFVPMTKFINKDGFQVPQTTEFGFDITVIDRETGDAARKRMNWVNAGALNESWNNMDDCGLFTLDGASNILAESLTISAAGSATTITTEAGTLQMTANILPVSATKKTAKWTVVNGTGRAKVDANGLVTAIMNGTVTVKGETKDGTFLSKTLELTISNQFISLSDVEVIKNGKFDVVKADGTADLWGGWGGSNNSPMPQVVDGVANCTPDGHAEVWQYQFSQEGLSALPGLPYTLSMVMSADADRMVTVDFEYPSTFERYGSSTHAAALGGTSEWSWGITTTPTKYTFDVIFDKMIDGKIQKIQYMLGQTADIVYIDNVSLIANQDIAKVGVEVTSLTVTSSTAVITTDNGTLQMSAAYFPANAGYQFCTWSVENGTGMAIISTDGLLSAIANGIVTVVATAKDGSGVVAKKEITLSNQINQLNQVLDVDGNTYNTVTIGTQIWMAENLKTTKYNDGTDIPLVTDGVAWAALSTPGYCWYNNDKAANKATYGALYNWYTVNTGKLCPIGWHVPANAEWTVLIDFLGGENIAGGKMKEEGFVHWASPNDEATNESGFTALPGGRFPIDYYDFLKISNSGAWWSSTEINGNAWGYTLFHATHPYVSTLTGGAISPWEDPKNEGFSMRCLRDF